MSFGGVGESQIMHDVISEGSTKGIMFVAAAGNDGSTEKFFPAAYPEVMAVTALDNGQLASYANRGDFVALAAPGTSIITYGDKTYYAMGTSEAAPRVAGTLAGYVETTHPTTTQSRDYLGTTFGFKPATK
jgi:subtilase family serine protease